MITTLIFTGQSILLYFVSRKTIQALYVFFKKFIKHDQIVYRMVALIYFPGTLIHEMSHFIAAMVLNLKVREVHILPKIRGHALRLGSVTYEKKDVVRGLLVGIAPFFAALFVFWFIDEFGFISIGNYFIAAIVGYMIFSVSSTMFSSKQDLVDLLYASPIFIFIAGLTLFFKSDIRTFFNPESSLFWIESTLKTLNGYLLFSLVMNGGIIITLQLLMKLKR